MSKIKTGVVSFTARFIVIAQGETESVMISNAKERLKEKLKSYPNLLTNLQGEPTLLVTVRNKKARKRNSNGKNRKQV